jgi:hypothetical protein
MRKELRDLMEADIPFADYDIGETLSLCRGLWASHWEATHRPLPDLPADDHKVTELVADTNFRVFHEVQFIWHYGLLRIHGIFEGLIDQEFLRTREVSSGLGARLRAMKALGYTIPPDDEVALTEWSKLRNVFAHRPPTSSEFWPRLEEEDVVEFAGLTERLVSRWQKESQGIVP